MAFYSLHWKRSAERELRKLPREIIVQLVALAESLRQNPIPVGSKKLTGTQNAYRVRSGDYRLIYEIRSNDLIIQIVRVGHRREVYR
jgi:mRNA interferase RelE/StbE